MPMAAVSLSNEPNLFFETIGEEYYVDAVQLAKDYAQLKYGREWVYRYVPHTPKPILTGPAIGLQTPVLGQVIPKYLETFLANVGTDNLDAVTYHYFPLQSDKCEFAKYEDYASTQERAVGAQALQHFTQYTDFTVQAVEQSGLKKPVWLEEAGLSACGGQDGVDNTYASSFYYLNSLGIAATRNVQIYARQNLIGTAACM